MQLFVPIKFRLDTGRSEGWPDAIGSVFLGNPIVDKAGLPAFAEVLPECHVQRAALVKQHQHESQGQTRFRGRNREFMRDRASLSWNLLLPVALVFGLSFVFSGDRNAYTIGVLQDDPEIDTREHPFLEMRYMPLVTG